MPANSAKAVPYDLKHALLEAWAVNERINQFLLEHLDERAWRAEPPGGKGRTVAAIVAHIHNVRHMWLASMRAPELFDKLDRKTVTRAEAARALGESARRCTQVLVEALARPDGKVKNFPPGVAGFFRYLVSHDAHHRGQILMLARQAGFPLPKEAQYGMWKVGRDRIFEVSEVE